jgi:hypothetical protein
LFVCFLFRSLKESLNQATLLLLTGFWCCWIQIRIANVDPNPLQNLDLGSCFFLGYFQEIYFPKYFLNSVQELSRLPLHRDIGDGGFAPFRKGDFIHMRYAYFIMLKFKEYKIPTTLRASTEEFVSCNKKYSVGGSPSSRFKYMNRFEFYYQLNIKGIVQPFELGGKTRLIRSAVKK